MDITKYVSQVEGEKGYDESKVLSSVLSFIDKQGLPTDGLIKAVHETVFGKHYNKITANEKVAEMYYNDGSKNVYGPFIPFEYTRARYDERRSEIPDYNVYDLYVTLNMIYSDNVNMLKKWFGDIREEELVLKCVEMAINWLNDNDNPFGNHKIWGYMNSD